MPAARCRSAPQGRWQGCSFPYFYVEKRLFLRKKWPSNTNELSVKTRASGTKQLVAPRGVFLFGLPGKHSMHAIPAEAAAAPKLPFYRQLYFQVV
ncbi:MAG: hypothetical protein KBT18_07940, partial [Comamonas sp.]|nr:hypothetical protein [Candidatus Comamonas equi]